MGKVVFGATLYFVGAVMGLLYLASEGGVTPGMSARQFLLALFVFGPGLLLAMGIFEFVGALLVVELPRRLGWWFKDL